MIRTQHRVFTTLCALLLLAPLVGYLSNAPTAAQQSSAPALTDAVPADVLAFVSTEFDLENDQYVQTTALAASLFVPGAGETLAVILQHLARIVGLIPADVQLALEGEIGIGVLNPSFDAAATPTARNDSGSDNSPVYALILHPDQAGAARKAVESWFAKQVGDRGAEVVRSQTGSVVVLTDPTRASDTTLTTPATVIFSGDYILLGADATAMTPFVEATQGLTPTLADSTQMATLAPQLPTERLLFGYVDGNSLPQLATGFLASSALVQSIDPPFGATAFALVADPIGLKFESVSQPAAGTAFPAIPGATNPAFASGLPGSTLAMFAGNDLGKSWLIQQLQKALLSYLMKSMGGEEIDLATTDIAAQFGVLAMLTGIDFKADLMDQLQGEYGAALFSLDPSDPLASSAVIASDLADVDRVSVGVTSIGPLLQSAAAGTVSITTSSVSNQTVNNVTLLTEASQPTVQYGVIDGRLMVGLGNGISILAQPPERSLADLPAYRAALAELPAVYSSIAYVDVRSIARQIAPALIQQLASDSSSPIAQCLLANMASATPTAVTTTMSGTAQALCSAITWLFGENAIENFLVSRVPGPLMAVTHQSEGLQHVSAVLLFDRATS